ncbi:MAG: type II toxin-antitoxin system VapB family antitoxin [Acidobacteriota bacterium]
MPLSIKSPEADRLARELAATTGESITVAVTTAIRERLAHEQLKRQDKAGLLADIRAIADHCAALPVLDTRSEDEILGYNEGGIPS